MGFYDFPNCKGNYHLFVIFCHSEIGAEFKDYVKNWLSGCTVIQADETKFFMPSWDGSMLSEHKFWNKFRNKIELKLSLFKNQGCFDNRVAK